MPQLLLLLLLLLLLRQQLARHEFVPRFIFFKCEYYCGLAGPEGLEDSDKKLKNVRLSCIH
jgi:hypothetical protein